jgi:hypothetical protein
MHERRRALAKPMPAGFATLLRPGTGALRKSGKPCRRQNLFGMDGRGKGRLTTNFSCGLVVLPLQDWPSGLKESRPITDKLLLKINETSF